MTATADSRFDRLGGAATIDRLVDSFYAQVERLPEAAIMRAMHPDDLSSTKEVLKRYLGEWTGGPALYSSERGHPRLRMRHAGFKIGQAERDAWLLCMRQALDDAVPDEVLRDELYADLVKLADWMRNQPGNAHDQRAAAQQSNATGPA
jgi:hemoglobin